MGMHIVCATLDIEDRFKKRKVPNDKEQTIEKRLY
jgi:hypothetical protein